MTKQIVITVGRLGRDPEMRYMPNGNPVTSFSMATDRQWKNSEGEKVKVTTWTRVSVFGKMADICNQYLQKGSLAYVAGHLNPDPTTGGPKVYQKQDGTWGAAYEVIAEDINFLSSSHSTTEAPSEHPSPEPVGTSEEDNPF